MMTRTIRPLSCAFGWLLLLAFLPQGSGAQPQAFQFQPEKVPTGTVFLYEKSNIDGSHASQVAVYVATGDRLESFKWSEGSGAATLVIADLDWESFTVRRFQSLRLLAGGERQTQATLSRVPGEPKLAVQAGPYNATVTIENWPWQSYDFDFAGLGILFPHLKDPNAPFTLGIADVVRLPNGPIFADKGPVTVTYQGEDKVAGTLCRRYTIDGEGLENRGGDLWVAAAGGYLVQYEIDLPDEPGFESGKLRLLERKELSREEWETFKAKKTAAE